MPVSPMGQAPVVTAHYHCDARPPAHVPDSGAERAGVARLSWKHDGTKVEREEGRRQYGMRAPGTLNNSTMRYASTRRVCQKTDAPGVMNDGEDFNVPSQALNGILYWFF